MTASRRVKLNGLHTRLYSTGRLSIFVKLQRMSDTTQLQFVYNAPDTDSWHGATMWNNVKKSGTNDLGYSYAKFFDSLYNYWARITADAGLTTDIFKIVGGALLSGPYRLQA